MMEPFRIIKPTSGEVPVLISVPHCGTAFPPELKDQYNSALIQEPDDTDWFVDTLYNFAPSLGMTMITAVFSRWVIDLNRDPESKPLYTDGRIITGLCPTTNFLGESLYNDHRKDVEPEEVNRRLSNYYWPYHHKLQEIITDLKNRFGKVLLWDCHSIRQVVPTIYQGKFPNLILGSADRTSASADLIEIALKTLGNSSYTLNHNHPFKGGFITRNYGNPGSEFHALQLEMTKVNYMDDSEKHYDQSRAEKMQRLLTKTLTTLAKKISS